MTGPQAAASQASGVPGLAVGADEGRSPAGSYEKQRRGLERRWRLGQLGLLSPALLLLGVLLVIPIGWLAIVSFSVDGHFSLEHYQRVVTDGSYARSALLTLRISAIVTVLAVVLGYPVAYLLSQLRPAWAILLLTFVAIPFWTSLLVRTYAWLVLLQREGLVNKLLMASGVTDRPLGLAHNEIGTIIGMLHIMLPFLILPLYASMRRIDRGLVLAASSLGASPVYAFWRVYFPLSLPGVAAGAILVFVLCLGFYITPAILGGGKTFVIAMLIERDVSLFDEWGAASAVAIAFVAVVLMLLYAVSRVLALEKLFEGR